MAGSKKTRLRLKQFFALIRQTLRSSAHSHGINRAPRSRTSCRSLPPRGCCACSPAKPALRPRLDEEELRLNASLGVGTGLPSPQPSPAQREREQREDDHAPSKKAEWSKWLHEQAGLEAVGKRAVEPCEVVIATTAKVALVKPSEAQARASAQLVCEPKATFFGDFLFCQKRKLPPAGQALG